MSSTAVFAALACLVGSAASAQVPPAPGAARPTPATAKPGLDDLDKIVCRSQRHTGSRFPVRTCMTQKEWRDQAEYARANADKISEKTKATLQRRSLSPAGDAR